MKKLYLFLDKWNEYAADSGKIIADSLTDFSGNNWSYSHDGSYTITLTCDTPLCGVTSFKVYHNDKKSGGDTKHSPISLYIDTDNNIILVSTYKLEPAASGGAVYRGINSFVRNGEGDTVYAFGTPSNFVHFINSVYPSDTLNAYLTCFSTRTSFKSNSITSYTVYTDIFTSINGFNATPGTVLVNNLDNEEYVAISYMLFVKKSEVDIVTVE